MSATTDLENTTEEFLVNRDDHPELYASYLKSLYKIENLRKHEEVNSYIDIYNLFKKNWSDLLMTNIFAFKAIVLNEKSQSVSLIYFEPDGKVNDEQMSMFFNVIKEEGGEGSSVVIAYNNPLQSLKASEREKKLAKDISSLGAKLGTDVKEQFLISPLGLLKTTRKKPSFAPF